MRDHDAIADRDHAKKATNATLTVLGQRLAGGEPSDLAAQLPTELKPLVDQHAGQSDPFGVEEFLRRVAEHEGNGYNTEQVADHVRAVFAVLTDAVTDGEAENVRSQLPSGYTTLFP